MPPHPRHCPLPDAQPALRALLPQGLRSPARNTHAREAIRGWEAGGPQGSPGEAPAPSRADTQRREPPWRTETPAAQPPRPGPPGRSAAAFVPGTLPLPFWGSGRGGERTPGTPRLRAGSGSPTPPISRNLHKRETQKCSKFACGRRCATPPPAPAWGAAAGSRRGEGGDLGKEGGGGRARKVKRGGGGREQRGGPRLPTRVPGPERKPRARISDPGPGDAAFSAFPPRAPFPFPHLDASRLPQPPLARYGLSRGPALAGTLPLLARELGCPVAQPTPLLRGLERASPGQGWAEGGMRRAPASGGGGQRGPRDRPQTSPY